MAKGYTRRQAADAAGVSLKTIDNYTRRGTINGRIQHIDGHGHMRIFTQQEINTIKKVLPQNVAAMPEALRRYVYGDNAPKPEDVKR